MSGEQTVIPGGAIDAKKAEKHREYMMQFRGSLAASALALAAIKKEETYVCDGYSTFRDFISEELRIGVTVAEILAAEGPLFSILEQNENDHDVLDAITSTEILRPIYKMPVERQKRCLQIAIESSPKSRAGRPVLTGAFVAEVAERHFQWKKDSKPARQKTKGDKPEGLIFLEKQLKNIAECGLTAEAAVEAYGPVQGWDYFGNALEFLRLAKRASPSKRAPKDDNE